MASNSARRRAQRAKRYVGVVWAVATALLALAVGILTALEDTQWVKDHPKLLVGLTIGLVSTGGLEALRLAWRRGRRHLEGDRLQDQTTAVIGALLAVSEKTGAPVADLGGSIFVVRRDWWTPFRPPSLRRTVRFRVAGPHASDVEWVIGKGAIGKAWETKRPEHCHWFPIARRWGDKDITVGDWERIKPADRWNLSREEFRGVVRKYAEVLAVPLVDPHDGDVHGVLAVDLAMKSRSASEEPILRSGDVEDIVVAAARAVASSA